MKAVCDSLGVARSNVHARHSRLASWVDRRSGRRPSDDEELAQALRAEVCTLPSYGYRRAQALVNRRRKAAGAARVNHKRVYRVMKSAGLLLPQAPKRPASTRQHNGTVAVTHSDTRWCSDGFEIRCDSGETVQNCPSDCAGTCGDGICHAGEQAAITACIEDIQSGAGVFGTTSNNMDCGPAAACTSIPVGRRNGAACARGTRARSP